MARYQPRRKRKGVIARWAIATIAAAVSVLGLVAVFRAPITETILITALESQGLAPVDLEVRKANPSAISITSLELGGDTLTAKSVDLTYSLSSLLRGRIKNVDISGLTLNGAWTEAGLSFGPIGEAIAKREGQTSSANAQLAPFDRIKISDTAAVIQHPQGLIKAKIELDISQSGPAWTFETLGTVVGPNTNASVALRGSLEEEDWLSTFIDGTISINACNFAIPEISEPVSADLDLKFSAENGVVSIGSRRDAVVSAPWPEALGNSENEDQSLELSIRSQIPSAPFLRIGVEGEKYKASTDLEVLLATPMGRASVALGGWALLGQNGRLEDFDFKHLTLQVDSLATPVGTLWAKVIGDGFNGDLTVAEGPVSVTGRLAQGNIGDLSFSQLDLNAKTEVRLDGLSLSFSIDQMSGQVTDGAYDSSVRNEAPVTFSLSEQAQAAQTATAAFAVDGSATATFDVALMAMVPSLLISQEDSPLLLSASVPGFLVAGDWASQGNSLDFTASLKNAAIRSEFGAVTDLSASIAGDLKAYSGPVTANIKLAGTRPETNAATVTSSVSYKDSFYIFKGVSETVSGKELGEFTLRYQPDVGSGDISARIGPLDFGGSGLGPSDLRPLALPFTPTSGQFAANFDMPIGDGTGDKRGGSVFMKDIEIESSAYAVKLMNAAINLNSIWPPQTDGPQTLAIGLLQAGVPVTDVTAEFDMRSAEKIDVSDVTMTFAEGRLQGGPFSIDLTGQTTTTRLQVTDVSLPTLAQLSTLNGLDASGVLSGVIPLRVTTDSAFIDQGTLTTSGPGHIRYKPAEAVGSIAANQSGEGGMGLALQALENFQYDSIAVTVSGSILEELEASLAIKGRNPALYNGYPIDFNLNLSGELANIIQGSLAGYRVPETIKRQLLAFPPKP